MNLDSLLKDIDSGKVQLPDFQRSWVWADDQIASLIESVVRRFPINAIMMLEYGGVSAKFKYRPVQGVKTTTNAPEELILDGQQRLTSLYNALFSQKAVKVVKRRGNNEFVERYYYLDMEKAVQSVKGKEVDEIVISKETPLTDEEQYDKNLYPANKMFDFFEWNNGYLQHHNLAPTKAKLAAEFGKEICGEISKYSVTEIVIEKETPILSVCTIFEKLNTGGVLLTVFDLLTAKFAAYTKEIVDLRKDIEEIREKFSDDNRPPILKEFAKNERDIGMIFVTALALVATFERSNGKSVSSKRESLLKLNAEDYLKFKNCIVEGFLAAGKFLTEEDIFCKKFMPYESQLTPLTAIFAELNFRGIKVNAAIKDKIREWYWCGIFGEMYTTAQDTQYANDIVQMMTWIKDDKKPSMLKDLQLNAFRLIMLRRLSSAAYTGIMAIILKNGAEDFWTKDSMKVTAQLAEGIDGHHIFPKKFCDNDLKLSIEKYDNVANKTPVSKSTNQKIGANAPSKYIANLDAQNGQDVVDGILTKHFIDPALCRADDFDAFIVDRAKKILDAIEKLTKQKVADRDSQQIIDIFGTSLI